MTENSRAQDAAAGSGGKAPSYRVLARKYRPSTFGELIGQEAMVRTLSNAIRNDRLAHAFILTGVRGIGKTTTARLIARALNCTGGDSGGRPTVDPCGSCQSCLAIAESRDVDVLEMDAASHTGVDDIREIIDSSRYAPSSSRYKVFIIDEVHMLSRSAFNALLKTLEEPPAHVKFIFATTEIRKVPVTVLSRCQRFDLRRATSQVLLDHLASIAGKENVEIETAALGMIVRAAEGSVRDGLSLLDQAIAHGSDKVTQDDVAAMLGLADRMRVFDLYDAVMSGDIAAALDQLADLYSAGAEPSVIIQDMLEITHWLTRLKAAPGAGTDVTVSEAERTQGAAMAGRLSMAVLSRCWQMLLKGLDETRRAPLPLAAAEMVLVRLAYVSDLPTPGDLARKLADAPSAAADTPRQSGRRPPASAPSAIASTSAAPSPQPEPAPETQQTPQPASFSEIAELVAENGEMVLYSHLVDNVHLVAFQPGRLEINPTPEAPKELPGTLGRLLKQWTGEPWIVTVTGEPGQATLNQQREAAEAQTIASLHDEPLVRAVMDVFPGAEIITSADGPGDTVTPFNRISEKDPA